MLISRSQRPTLAQVATASLFHTRKEREGEGGRRREGAADAWVLPGYGLTVQPQRDPELRSAPGHSDLIITPGLMPFLLML